MPQAKTVAYATPSEKALQDICHLVDSLYNFNKWNKQYGKPEVTAIADILATELIEIIYALCEERYHDEHSNL